MNDQQAFCFSLFCVSNKVPTLSRSLGMMLRTFILLCLVVLHLTDAAASLTL